MKQLLCNQSCRMLSALLFSILVFGCAGIPGTTQNWTRYFQEKPNRLGDYPHLVGTPILGGVYELRKDMLLVGAPGRNRYTIRDFGASGFPQTPEEYYADKHRSALSALVHGFLKSGTRLRGTKVERYLTTSPSVPSRQGVIYEIMDGSHQGKLLAGIIPLVENDLMGSVERVDPKMLEQRTNPEIVREITPPYLDIRGQPVD